MSHTVFIGGSDGLYENYCAALHAVDCGVCLSHDWTEVQACDALLLPGGGDIFTSLDEQEYLLIQSFVDTNRPIFGICRGMQALNVWFGGTLHAHISGHQLPRGDMVHTTHTVGLLNELLGQTPFVNSNHHQAIAQLGEELIPIQWADDGIIEAVCHKSLPIWGVQWHPERQSYAMCRSDAADAAPLFAYFRHQMR